MAHLTVWFFYRWLTTAGSEPYHGEPSAEAKAFYNSRQSLGLALRSQSWSLTFAALELTCLRAFESRGCQSIAAEKRWSLETVPHKGQEPPATASQRRSPCLPFPKVAAAELLASNGSSSAKSKHDRAANWRGRRPNQRQQLDTGSSAISESNNN